MFADGLQSVPAVIIDAAVVGLVNKLGAFNASPLGISVH